MALIQSLVELKTCLCAHLRPFFTHIHTYYTEFSLLCVCFSAAIFVCTHSHRTNNFRIIKPNKSHSACKLFSQTRRFIFIFQHAEIWTATLPLNFKTISHVVQLCCYINAKWVIQQWLTQLRKNPSRGRQQLPIEMAIRKRALCGKFCQFSTKSVQC